jgi:hypothetical protein
VKILVLGDIHGRGCWEPIIEKENPDLTIFLGDYVSSHGLITEKQQIDNLERILQYNEENPDTVILLRGNHDMESLYYWAECYPSTGPFVKSYMSKNKERFLNNTQWVYLYKNICFSHAGVSSIWMENNNIKSLEDINTLEPSEVFAFTGKMSDFTGISPQQPPTWIRPWTLIDCAYKGYIHVVGHTSVKPGIKNIKEEYIKHGSYSQVELDHFADVWCCDALPEEYLIIENDKFIVNRNG